MFSGIVEAVGKIASIKNYNSIRRLTIEAPSLLSDSQIGDSIAVNGVCLTVVALAEDHFTAEVVPETQRCTNLGLLQQNSLVNLERSIVANQRISGHFVQGHVDARCEIIDITEEGDAWLLTLTLPSDLKPYVVNKGYIALDGMSLTVIAAKQDYFTLTLIPHTREVTLAQYYHVGSIINLEADMLGKYAVRFMEVSHG